MNKNGQNSPQNSTVRQQHKNIVNAVIWYGKRFDIWRFQSELYFSEAEC